MSSREFYLERRRSEHPVFVRVLQSIPADRADYKPHERSQSAAEIAWTMTNELRSCIDAAATGRGEWKTDPPPPLPEMVQLFERLSNELSDTIEKMDDASWERVAQFYNGGKMVAEMPVGQFIWFILFDAIHHRGQLTTYLRPMGAKVPAIYGPSADSRG
jgi:uncharacterized damage-inducible protein DinB